MSMRLNDALPILPMSDAGMAAWEAQAVQQLALGLAAFATPHTTPQEDVELLLGQAASGGLSLLQVWDSRDAPIALPAVCLALPTVCCATHWPPFSNSIMNNLPLFLTSLHLVCRRCRSGPHLRRCRPWWPVCRRWRCGGASGALAAQHCWDGSPQHAPPSR